MTDFLEAQTLAAPEQAEHWSLLGEQYTNKLWKQLSETLTTCAMTEYFQTAPRLIELYDGFVVRCADRFNPLTFAAFASRVSVQYTDEESRQKFFAGVLERVGKDAQAALLVQLQMVACQFANNKIAEGKVALDKAQTALDAYPGVMDSSVQSLFHRATFTYHKAQGNAADYYKHALLYLTYTPLADIAVVEQQALASDVGLAAILAENVYNFGELLQSPIVQVLKGTAHEWVYDLLFAFNAGDIAASTKLVADNAGAQPRLKVKAEFLAQKIRVMQLMERVFAEPSSAREFTFASLAESCRVPLEQVELLLIKAFSLKVVRGTIDQIDETVRITWVQPRVLDAEQIRGMKTRLDGWAKEVATTSVYLEENAPEFAERRF